MTALDKHTNTPQKKGDFVQYGVAADTQLYKGGLAVINTSGYLEMAAAKLANGILAGIVIEPNTSTSSTAGAVKATVQRDFIHELNCASITVASIGKPVYAVDDNTVTLTATDNGTTVGNVVNVINTNKAYIKLAVP